MTDTTIAGMVLAQRMAVAYDSEECPHVTFPEVMAVDYAPSLLGGILQQLAEGLQEGMPLDVLASAAEHALIIAFAGGMAAGKAEATESLLDSFEEFSLDSVDWGALPNTEEGE